MPLNDPSQGARCFAVLGLCVRILGTKTCQSELAADRRAGGDRACPNRRTVPAQLLESRFFQCARASRCGSAVGGGLAVCAACGISSCCRSLPCGAAWTTQRKWREWLTKHLLALWLRMAATAA